MNASTPASFFTHSPEEQRAKRLGVRGDRSKLAQRFVADAYAIWEEQGESALRRFIFHDPGGFAKMVAGLLPQKLEITHPTDGLSDDRLAFLLQMAEHMAQRLSATDEKRLIDITPERGAGGPERVGVVAGEGCPSSDRAAENPVEPNLHNGLEDEARSATPTAEEAILPYPVGRATPEADHVIEARNKAKLNDDEGVSGSERDIDPASLF